MTKNESNNFVLHAKSEQFYWEGNGQLSIKTFFNGKAHYKTNKGFFAVEESRYLLLNKGAYTISIDEPKVVESFCLFFKDGFAEEVLHSLKETNDRFLSDSFKDTSSIGFFEKPIIKIVFYLLNWKISCRYYLVLILIPLVMRNNFIR